MLRSEVVTVQALRSDMALQITRCVQTLGVNQLAAAKHLGLPQPTLSKIMNGRVSDLSLELLIRIAVRARLPVTLQTGREPEEAGVFVSRKPVSLRSNSKLARDVRESMSRSARRLTPTERVEAFLEHSQLMAALHSAGRAAETDRRGVVMRR
jgi:predicted XRE-type DNA-binding protein